MHHGPSSPRERHDHVRRQNCNVAIAGFARTVERVALGITPKTVAEWRKRASVEDLKTGPKEPRSTVLTEAEDAAVVPFRRYTLLPPDDCLFALQPSIPQLTHSALHRRCNGMAFRACLMWQGASRDAKSSALSDRVLSH